MQILQWLLRVADEPPKESLSSAKTKEVMLPNQLESNQRRKGVRKISLGCENFTLFTLLRRRDITKSCFYNTLNLKRVDTTKMMEKEVNARGLGINNNKELDVAANHVRSTKVLPLAHDALSSRQQLGNREKGDPKAKSGKTKTLSKMKELVRWAAAAKSEKGGKSINQKVSQFRNREASKWIPDDGKQSNDSPKISSRWEMESCSTTSSFHSALSKASSNRIIIDQTKNIHHSSNSTPVRDSNHSTTSTTKSGNWITTDSDCESFPHYLYSSHYPKIKSRFDFLHVFYGVIAVLIFCTYFTELKMFACVDQILFSTYDSCGARALKTRS